ncbi:MAG: methyltransferase domain-containing protein [Chloroflexota bacterium]
MLNLDQQERLRDRYKTTIKPGHRMGLDVYRDLLATHITPQTRVLDVGCGPAGLVAEYQHQAGFVAGTDRYLTNFTEFDGQFGIHALAEGDMDALSFENASFDLVTCSWVLEHLANPVECMREVSRVLAPGGRFLYITPNALNYVVWLRRMVPELASKRIVKAIYDRDEDFINPTFYRMNTPDDIERICSAAGLVAEEVHLISDPTYLALNEPLFRLSIVAEQLLEAAYPQGFVHLVGVYRKLSG